MLVGSCYDAIGRNPNPFVSTGEIICSHPVFMNIAPSVFELAILFITVIRVPYRFSPRVSIRFESELKEHRLRRS
jgi:hypothetical protein